MSIKIRRLIAVLIDYAIILCTVSLSFLYPVNFIINAFHSIIVNIFWGLVSILLLINLFIRKDCLLGYESIGKKIMRLKIYQNEERVSNKKLLMDRVASSFSTFPLYIFMILSKNKSTGDEIYNTVVK